MPTHLVWLLVLKEPVNIYIKKIQIYNNIIIFIMLNESKNKINKLVGSNGFCYDCASST